MSLKKLYTHYFILGSLIIGFFTALYYLRVGSLGFVDEFNNILVARFMHHGLTIYQDIFHNHQPGAPFFSYILQEFYTTSSVFSMIKLHRLFMLAWSGVWAFLILARFKHIGLASVLLFEYSKYYFLGFLFLPEALIAYPVMYLFGSISGLLISREKYSLPSKLQLYECSLVTIITALIIIMREVYIPLALVLYISHMVLVRHTMKVRLISLLSLIIIGVVTITFLPMQDYLYQLIQINAADVGISEVSQYGGIAGLLLRNVAYPFLYFMPIGLFGTQRYIVMALIALLLAASIYLITKKKVSIKNLLWIYVLLMLSAIRPIEPGQHLYAGFKLILWIGSLCMLLPLLLQKSLSSSKYPARYALLTAFMFASIMLNPQSYIWEKPNIAEDFDKDYSRFFNPGRAVQALKTNDSKLFIDGYDSLLYFTGDIQPAYQYAFFYPPQYRDKTFLTARERMFIKTPPDFYYRNCISPETVSLPQQVKGDYKQLIDEIGPSCLYVHTSLLDRYEDPDALIEDIGYHVEY